MKQTLTTHGAADQLMQDEYANWSFSGALALIEHLEEYEDAAEIELEFDRVALRCDFSEYESALACIEECGYSCDVSDEDDPEAYALEYLQDHTTVIEFDGGIIVGAF